MISHAQNVKLKTDTNFEALNKEVLKEVASGISKAVKAGHYVYVYKGIRRDTQDMVMGNELALMAYLRSKGYKLFVTEKNLRINWGDA